MANEWTFRLSGQLKSSTNNNAFNSSPAFQSFQPNFAGTNGPTPGSVSIATAGTQIVLTALSAQGGWCLLANLDLTNYVTMGVYNGSTFFPMLELLPGEFKWVRLSRTLVSGGNVFYAKANTAAVELLVQAFDA